MKPEELMKSLVMKFQEKFGRNPNEEEMMRLQEMMEYYMKNGQTAENQLNKMGVPPPDKLPQVSLPGTQVDQKQMASQGPPSYAVGGTLMSLAPATAAIPVAGPFIAAGMTAAGGVATAIEKDDEKRAQEVNARSIEAASGRGRDVNPYMATGGEVVAQYKGGSHESGNDIPVGENGMPTSRDRAAAMTEGDEMVVRAGDGTPAHVFSRRLETENEKGDPETYASMISRMTKKMGGPNNKTRKPVRRGYNASEVMERITGDNDINRKGRQLFYKQMEKRQDMSRELSKSASDFLAQQKPEGSEGDLLDVMSQPMTNIENARESNQKMDQLSQGMAYNNKLMKDMNKRMSSYMSGQKGKEKMARGGAVKRYQGGGGIDPGAGIFAAPKTTASVGYSEPQFDDAAPIDITAQGSKRLPLKNPAISFDTEVDQRLPGLQDLPSTYYDILKGNYTENLPSFRWNGEKMELSPGVQDLEISGKTPTEMAESNSGPGLSVPGMKEMVDEGINAGANAVTNTGKKGGGKEDEYNSKFTAEKAAALLLSSASTIGAAIDAFQPAQVETPKYVKRTGDRYNDDIRYNDTERQMNENALTINKSRSELAKMTGLQPGAYLNASRALSSAEAEADRKTFEQVNNIANRMKLIQAQREDRLAGLDQAEDVRVSEANLANIATAQDLKANLAKEGTEFAKGFMEAAKLKDAQSFAKYINNKKVDEFEKYIKLLAPDVWQYMESGGSKGQTSDYMKDLRKNDPELWKTVVELVMRYFGSEIENEEEANQKGK